MATFLPEAIDSVLSQDYPRIDYLVMDGGSTDGTVDILRSYGKHLRYVSALDRGTADAINRGCQDSRGTIFAWLNADDAYLPGAIRAAVERLTAEPEAGAVYGEAHWVDWRGEVLGRYPTQTFDPQQLSRECYICQPACFLRKSAFEEAGGLDPELQCAFDYDLWIRMAARHRFVKIERYLATSRMHSGNKTLGRRSEVFAESIRVLKRHYGYVPFQWVYGDCCYLLDHRDQFRAPLRPSVFKYLLSLPVGCWHNPGQLGRFFREWSSVMTLGGFVRRFNRVRPGHAQSRYSDPHSQPPEGC